MRKRKSLTSSEASRSDEAMVCSSEGGGGPGTEEGRPRLRRRFSSVPAEVSGLDEIPHGGSAIPSSSLPIYLGTVSKYLTVSVLPSSQRMLLSGVLASLLIELGTRMACRVLFT